MNERVEFTPTIHGDITREANAGILNNQQLAFVVLANIAQDLHQMDGRRHFDNCCFAEGVAYIEEEWCNMEAEDDRYSESALGTFGRLLHTVQDFYAHSNWVELNLSQNQIPVWDMNLNSLPSGIVSGTWIIGFPKKCDGTAPTHEQLNKDDANSEEGKKVVSSGPNEGKTLFALARDAAIRAGSMQFEKLIAQT